MACIWEENVFSYQLEISKMNLSIFKKTGEDSVVRICEIESLYGK